MVGFFIFKYLQGIIYLLLKEYMNPFEQILNIEYERCQNKAIYAIEKYLKTFDKTQEGFVEFKLFPRQKEIIKSYQKHKRNIVTKPRQAGVSTTTAAYLAIQCAFANRDKLNPEIVLIIANKQTLAQQFLSKVRDFLDQIPDWVWKLQKDKNGNVCFYEHPKDKSKNTYLKTDSKGHLKLLNGAEIKAVATSKDALRGYTPTYCIFDEAAFIDNGAEVFGAAMTSLGTGGACALISTPNGMDDLYYKTFDGAKTGKNNFNIVEMKWYEDIRYNRGLVWSRDEEKIICEDIGRTATKWEYNGNTYLVESTGNSDSDYEPYRVMINDGWKPTSYWYDSMCEDMNHDSRMIAQELDVSFIGSGGNVIDFEHITFHEKNNIQDPVWVDGPDNEYWIWKQPEEGHQYILGADVSRGDGEDSSTIVIIDFTTMEQVMEYQGKVQPDLFADIIYRYGNLYKAYSVVDITGGMGIATVLKLLDLDYKYLHYDAAKSKALAMRADINQHAKDNGKKIPGFNVGSDRLPMIANLEKSIRLNEIKIRSSRMTSEMKTFIYKNGRPDHMDGYHDDLLMSLAMGLWVLQHSFKNLERMERQAKAMLASWSVASPTNTSTDFSRSGSISSRPKPKVQSGMISTGQNNNKPYGANAWLFNGMK